MTRTGGLGLSAVVFRVSEDTAFAKLTKDPYDSLGDSHESRLFEVSQQGSRVFFCAKHRKGAGRLNPQTQTTDPKPKPPTPP